MKQAQDGCVLAYKFKGKRFDCGSAEGYIEATNFCYENLYKTGKAHWSLAVPDENAASPMGARRFSYGVTDHGGVIRSTRAVGGRGVVGVGRITPPAWPGPRGASAPGQGNRQRLGTRAQRLAVAELHVVARRVAQARSNRPDGARRAAPRPGSRQPRRGAPDRLPRRGWRGEAEMTVIVAGQVARLAAGHDDEDEALFLAGFGHPDDLRAFAGAPVDHPHAAEGFVEGDAGVEVGDVQRQVGEGGDIALTSTDKHSPSPARPYAGAVSTGFCVDPAGADAGEWVMLERI